MRRAQTWSFSWSLASTGMGRRLRLAAGAAQCFVAAVLGPPHPAPANATSLIIRWTKNLDPEVSGYRVYLGTESGRYGAPVDVGDQSQYTVAELGESSAYFVAVTAYTPAGSESAFSTEVRADVPRSPADTDGDGILDDDDNDDDNDTLADTDERLRGTDPQLADTDHDSVSDGAEVERGSDPLDPASGPLPFIQRVCSSWAGQLQTTWNIVEAVNNRQSVLHGAAALYPTVDGRSSKAPFTVLPSGKFASLLNTYPEFRNDSAGLFCLSHDGTPSQLSGEVVQYHLALSTGQTNGKTYDYAYALGLTSANTGSKFILYDTSRRSTRKADMPNLVANWIEVSNPNDALLTGRIRFYGSDGSLRSEQTLDIPPNGQARVPAHRWAPGSAGLTEWVPDLGSTEVIVRSLRYYYDNVGTSESFSTASAETASQIPTERTAIPLTTELAQSAVVVIANVLQSPATATLSIRHTDGKLLHAFSPIGLAPKAVWQATLDPWVKKRPAVLVVEGSPPQSLLSTVIQFAKNRDGSLAYLYHVPAASGATGTLRGVTSTAFEQSSEIVVVALSSSAQQVLLTFRDSAGNIIEPTTTLTVPALGLQKVQISKQELNGTVEIQPAADRSIAAWIARRRAADYAMTIPLR